MANEIRILVKYHGKLHKVAKLGITDRDGSLYIFPYSNTGKYYAAIQQIGVSESHGQETQIDLDKHFSIEDANIPKISLHQSGQVHVDIAGVRIGPLNMGDFSSLRDEHIASITIERIGRLPIYSGSLRLVPNAKKYDHVFDVEDGVESGVIRIFVNGRENNFSQKCGVGIQMSRPSLQRPINFCVSPRGQTTLAKDIENASPGEPGTIVLSGWDIQRMKGNQPTDILVLRGI